MTDAAPTPGLTNPSTAAVRLLAVIRWFVILLIISLLIIRGRKLAAALRQGTAHPHFPAFAKRFGTNDPAAILARVTGCLRRAAALQAELFATGPADQRLADLAHCRAIGAQILDLGRELGIFPDAPATAHTIRRRVQRRWFPLAPVQPAATARKTCAQPTATGPPQRTPRPLAGEDWATKVAQWSTMLSSKRGCALELLQAHARAFFAVRPFLTRAARIKPSSCRFVCPSWPSC